MKSKEFIVDLHIHSHYSRATSKEMNIESLYRWAKIKGINVIGTGDFTHPAWFAELRDKLELDQEDLYKLKDEYAKKQDELLPPNLRTKDVRFILTVEISNIYTRHGKGRRLHNLVLMPDLEAAAEFSAKLQEVGNLKSDGRPILGIDSRDLLEMTLQTDKEAFFIPAHIWTPWFAMFGSKSGFDSVEEAFGDLTTYIKAVETGLSSDPFMNWRLSAIDGLTLVSNSDAHSPAKLGREANVLETKLGYKTIVNSIKEGDEGFVGTIEFFPEEGKYHYDGHRTCGVRLKPSETKKLGGKCPRCGKQVVVGVEHRVEELADRPEEFKPTKHKRVEYIIPLSEIIGEVEGVGSQSQRTKTIYEKMTASFGDEFSILRKVDTESIKKAGLANIALAIERMRKGDVVVEPGYDGLFGTIKVFLSREEMQKKVSGQIDLF